MLQGAGSLAGGALRRSLPSGWARGLDAAGGLVLGALTGLAVAWMLGAVALHLPGQPDLRRSVQRSVVLQELNQIVSPRAVLSALARVDPFPTFAGPEVLVRPPDPRVLESRSVERAAPSVVRVLGSACGLGIAGSGWIAAPGLVVTAAHVVAGQDDTTVVPSAGPPLSARAVAFDPANDVAVLRVEGLEARSLPTAEPKSGTAVAILGYPGNGPFDARPGRLGQTVSILGEDAYGRRLRLRTVTTFRARVRQGNSGGPAVNAAGQVVTTVFAARPGGTAGYGVPTNVVRRALARSREPVDTGACAR
jgi:S1-C subfamily serine protease